MTLARSTAAADAPIATILEIDFGLVETATAPHANAPIAPAPSNSSRLKRAIREADDEGELANLIDEVISIRKS